MKNILCENPDGSVSIIYPNKKSNIERDLGRTLTDAQYEAHVKAASISSDVVSWRHVEDAEIPADRTFRDAWNKELAVDMVKAREIVKLKTADHAAVDKAASVEELKAFLPEEKLTKLKEKS